MEGFDLQSIWTAAGMSAAAVVVGFVFGFVQSAIPAFTNSAEFRNWALIVISALLVGAAAVTSGAQPNVSNIIGGVLVFIGVYNAAKNAHGGGEATAQRTTGGAEIGSSSEPADGPVSG